MATDWMIVALLIFVAIAALVALIGIGSSVLLFLYAILKRANR
jgi:hypothetical protein